MLTVLVPKSFPGEGTFVRKIMELAETSPESLKIQPEQLKNTKDAKFKIFPQIGKPGNLLKKRSVKGERDHGSCRQSFFS